MRDVIEKFVREGPGAWTCIAPVSVELPGGRIQVAAGTRLTRGTTFMGIELARMLDEHYERERARR